MGSPREIWLWMTLTAALLPPPVYWPSMFPTWTILQTMDWRWFEGVNEGKFSCMLSTVIPKKMLRYISLQLWSMCLHKLCAALHHFLHLINFFLMRFAYQMGYITMAISPQQNIYRTSIGSIWLCWTETLILAQMWDHPFLWKNELILVCSMQMIF